MKVYKGHRYYELNCQTRKITEVNELVVVQPYCLYTTALNQTNAAKKFLKMVNTLPKKPSLLEALRERVGDGYTIEEIPGTI